MTVDENIDLTLEAIFAGDHNPLLLLRDHYNYQGVHNCKALHPGSNGMSEERVFGIRVEDMSPSLYSGFRNCLSQSKYREKQDYAYMSLYQFLFDALPPLISHYDPWAEYHFCAGYNCDCCGVELNPLNRGSYRTLCEGCSERERHPVDIL